MKAQKKARRAEHGQALVEFALIIPLLVLILMGVFDLGRGIYAYNVVASAAREGARYGILNPTDTPPGIENTAKANTAALDQSQIAVSKQCSPCTAGNPITVTVTYTFQPVTAFFATFTVTGKSTMTIE